MILSIKLKGTVVTLKRFIMKLSAALLSLTMLAACGKSSETAFSGFRKVGDETVMMDTSQWGELNTHDPSVFKDGDTYYVFSTDASYGDAHKSGVQIRKSADLITWEYVGPAFDNYAEDCAEAVKYAKLDTSKNQGFWAPDVVKAGDTYRMYYSASTFGSSRSCIAMAQADKITGPYTDKGIVISSEVNAVKNPNAIDPAFITDRDGNMFMSYGSFFGGIFIVQLDNETGFVREGAEPVRIAGGRSAAVEGSYILYLPETDYFYLFVSYGSLSSDYNVRVARSKDIGGPYLDANGRDMATLAPGNEETVGTKLLGGYTFLSGPGILPSKGYMAPGHNSALADGEDYFLVHHVRTYALPEYWFYMNVRRFALNTYGWPVVAPNRYHGERLEAADLPEGEYGLIRHGSDSNAKSHDSEKISLQAGKIGGAAQGEYRLYEDYRIELTVDGVVYDGIVLKQYDWEREKDVTAFTAMSESGLCIWGCTQL